MSLDASEWRTLVPAPLENSGFTERGKYAFARPGDGWTMMVDDAPLALEQGTQPVWTWEPGFYAGEVTAVLSGPGGSPTYQYLLDVAPEPSKVGRDTFNTMLDELWSFDPELVIGSEPASVITGEVGDTENVWLELWRVRQYLPEFLRAATVLGLKPRATIRAHRTTTALHHARRVDRQTAVALSRGPGIALFTPQAELPHTTRHTDVRFDVPTIQQTLDSAANRAMLALLQRLRVRVRALRDRLRVIVAKEQPSDTRTSLKDRWPAREQALAAFGCELERLARRTPFRDVRRAEITAAGLTAIAADPLYARAWGRGWRALRRGLDSADRTARLWMSPSWEIYERWCYARFAALLEQVAPEWQWRRRAWPHRLLGKSEGRRAVLALQPTFSSRDTEGPGMWSVSRERIPDIVFSVETGEGARFVVLDAKYRTSRTNVLDAMASTHIYQDSLRIGTSRAEASLLLVPAGGGAPWLEQPAFHDAHRVGVYPFAPGSGCELPAAIRALL